MKAAKFDCERPADLDGALRLLEGGGDVYAKVLAGGQSLGPMLNLRLAQPGLLVDITRIPELTRVEDDGEALVLGACVTHAMIEDGKVPDVTGGALPSVASAIAYRGVRNRGTIGGSVAHADPAADWPTALSAIGAEAVVRAPSGSRTVAVSEFILGVFETVMGEDEILEAIRIPKLSAGARWGYYKVCRKPGEFADAIGAVLVDVERSVYRLTIGATNAKPITIADAREALGGDGVLGAFFDLDAARCLVDDADTNLDDMERHIHAVALKRAVEQVAR
ncbi:MAG TPA: FAD binding domain-containing protein [Rhodospirillales bacterium]|jgi:carbon-monoxide dehydrogenase medium subunit|nr:FAD binding domain-containing protein [Rhodospirillales bacterium]